jgi:2-haloacid dehalogenase
MSRAEVLEPHRVAVEAGLRVFTLSNGAAATTELFLRRSGLDRHVEQVLSIDKVRTWKPAPAPYQLAIERAGVPADFVALVAVHSWDVHGAHAAGMTTGWCSRLETIPTPVFALADVPTATLARRRPWTDRTGGDHRAGVGIARS